MKQFCLALIDVQELNNKINASQREIDGQGGKLGLWEGGKSGRLEGQSKWLGGGGGATTPPPPLSCYVNKCTGWHSLIESTLPNTLVSLNVVQFQRRSRNWCWHSPMPSAAPRPTTPSRCRERAHSSRCRRASPSTREHAPPPAPGPVAGPGKPSSGSAEANRPRYLQGGERCCIP